MIRQLSSSALFRYSQSFCGMTSYIHSDRGSSFLSQELKSHLSHWGNGLVEMYNWIIWKAVRLALKSSNLPDSLWELVVRDALHSIRSLLFTSTNTTLHERFIGFQRHSSCYTSMPSWLISPGPVLLCWFTRTSKNDPLVDQVELKDANPMYAHVHYMDGQIQLLPFKT